MRPTAISANSPMRQANRRVALRLLGVVAGSLLFAAAQPRLYKSFCEWTGIYDIDRADKLAHSAQAGRALRIEFDANSFDNGLRFSPVLPTLAARTGEFLQMSYRVENTRATTVIGQAVPSYGPQMAGGYIVKLACFCFKQQTFAPHEIRELPVVFMVDPKLPPEVKTVTLSYTFFEVPAGSEPGVAVKTREPL